MKKKMIMTMCGVMIFSSVFGGSFAETTKATKITEIKNTAACVLSESFGVYEVPKWEDYKSMLKKDTNKTTETQLKTLFNAAVTLDQKIYKEDIDVKESDAKKVDASWEKFWVEADKNLDVSQFEMTDMTDIDYNMVYEAPKWEDYKSMLKKDINKTTETQLKTLFNAAVTLDQKIYKEDVDVKEADAKKVDASWEKFWVEADKNLDVSQFEMIDIDCDMVYEAPKWEDYKSMLKNDINKTTETQLKTLFNAAVTLDQKIYKEDVEVKEADAKEVEAVWEKFWVEADKHLDEIQFEVIGDAEMKPMTWKEYKVYFGTELTKANEVVLEKLYKEATTAEKKIVDGKKEITEKDYELLNKVWDKYYTEEDKYTNLSSGSTK